MLGGPSLRLLSPVHVLRWGQRVRQLAPAVSRPVGTLQVKLQPTLHARVPVVLDVIVGPAVGVTAVRSWEGVPERMYGSDTVATLEGVKSRS